MQRMTTATLLGAFLKASRSQLVFAESHKTEMSDRAQMQLECVKHAQFIV